MDAREKEKILKELGDIPQETYDELVRFFIGQLAQAIPQLKGLVACGDWQSLAKAAHSLKGSSGNLRLSRVYEAAIRINDLAKQCRGKDDIIKDIALLEESIPQLKNEFGVGQ